MEAVKKYKVNKHFSLFGDLFVEGEEVYVCTEKDDGWYRMYLFDKTSPGKIKGEVYDKLMTYLTEIK